MIDFTVVEKGANVFLRPVFGRGICTNCFLDDFGEVDQVMQFP